MEGGPPIFRQDCTCPALLEDAQIALPVRDCHPLWCAFPDASGSDPRATGLVRVRSPLLAESRLMSFPPGTEMFQFPGFASPPYGFRRRSPSRAGLPHSEISGSTFTRNSPELFAACHVLHRLSVPRHPPNALIALDPSKSRHAQRPAINPGPHQPQTNTQTPPRRSRQDTALPFGRCNPERSRAQGPHRPRSGSFLFTMSTNPRPGSRRTKPIPHPGMPRGAKLLAVSYQLSALHLIGAPQSARSGSRSRPRLR